MNSLRLAILILFGLATPMPMLAAETKEQSFWNWFVKNEVRLFQVEKDQSALFGELGAAMSKVHEDLTFEFGPVDANGKRGFVISAGGIKAAFPSVESLHAAAPALPRWKFIKFRPRRASLSNVEFGGVTVEVKNVHYALFKDHDPKKVGIMLFLEGYVKAPGDSKLEQAGYLMLDEALGEFEVETYAGAIVFFGRDSKYFERGRPIEELQGDFDNWLKKQKSGE